MKLINYTSHTLFKLPSNIEALLAAKEEVKKSDSPFGAVIATFRIYSYSSLHHYLKHYKGCKKKLFRSQGNTRIVIHRNENCIRKEITQHQKEIERLEQVLRNANCEI